MSGSEWPTWLKANARRVNALSSAVSLIFFHSIPLDLSILKKKSDDYFNAGYGRIIMVPRVKLAYDRKVWDIIHPERRNLTAIRGYKRIGGLPDDPHSDPQDRSWYGPHDRLFTPEETEELEFVPGPEYGKSITVFFCPKSARKRKKKKVGCLLRLLQCGAGVGTVLVILTDRMWTRFGNTCNLGHTLKRRSRSSITEICLDGRFLKKICVRVGGWYRLGELGFRLLHLTESYGLCFWNMHPFSDVPMCFSFFFFPLSRQ